MSKQKELSSSSVGKHKPKSRQQKRTSFPARTLGAELPAGYVTTLASIKERIRTDRQRTILAANAAMVLLYWDIGKLILDRQKQEGWGAKIIDHLSSDLRTAFPGMRGLSPRNLKYMRSFAATWPDSQIVQQVAAQIPWFHNVVLMNKIKDTPTRLWYAKKASDEGWSRNVLVNQIETRLHSRKGQAVTNFGECPVRAWDTSSIAASVTCPRAGSHPSRQETALCGSSSSYAYRPGLKNAIVSWISP